MTRVLVVDDQEVIRDIVADLLASNGHMVIPRPAGPTHSR
jgi:CheY-like chemotaxis protein